MKFTKTVHSFFLLTFLLSPMFVFARGGASYFPGAIVTSSPKHAKRTADPDDIRLNPTISTISTAALKALLNAEVDVTLVDARDPKYDDRVRIGGAVALCIKNSDKEIVRALPSKKRLIVVYCGDLQCPASQYMGHRLNDMGYDNVIEYPYGIKGWREAKLPTTRDRKKRR